MNRVQDQDSQYRSDGALVSVVILRRRHDSTRLQRSGRVRSAALSDQGTMILDEVEASGMMMLAEMRHRFRVILPMGYMKAVQYYVRLRPLVSRWRCAITDEVTMMLKKVRYSEISRSEWLRATVYVRLSQLCGVGTAQGSSKRRYRSDGKVGYNPLFMRAAGRWLTKTAFAVSHRVSRVCGGSQSATTYHFDAFIHRHDLTHWPRLSENFSKFKRTMVSL